MKTLLMSLGVFWALLCLPCSSAQADAGALSPEKDQVTTHTRSGHSAQDETSSVVVFHSGSAAEEGELPTGLPMYDPTNGVSAARPQPFSRILTLVRSENSTMPVRIVFKVRQAPGNPDRGAEPREWTHVISSPDRIQSIMNAIASVRRKNAYWWRLAADKHEYVYRLTFDFRSDDDGTGVFVESMTLNLSDMIGNAFDFRPLEDALAPYSPGFKAQRRAVLQ